MREASGHSSGPSGAADAGPGVRAAAASGRGEVIRAYANGALGRETLRRELVEGASVQAGQDALVLCDAQPADGVDEIVRVVVGMLLELGLRVAVMAVDGIPVRAGATAGAWAHVEKHRAPAAVYEAIRAADVVLDYTAQSRGAQKYNQDFYTLAMYYAKRICAHRALEAGEGLGTDPSAPIAQPDALLMPSDLLRLIAEHVSAILIGAAKSRQELRLTNPWGTDLRFTMLPGDVVPSGGIRHYPERTMFAHAGDDNNRLYVTLAGCTVTQQCDGVWVTKHCSLLGGELREPIQVRFADGFSVGADGGGEARRLM